MLEVVGSKKMRRKNDKKPKKMLQKKMLKKKAKKQAKKVTKTTNKRKRGDKNTVVEIYEDVINYSNLLPGWFDDNTLSPLSDMTTLGEDDGQMNELPLDEESSIEKVPIAIDTNVTDEDYQLDIPDELTENRSGFNVVGGGVVSLQEYLNNYQMVCSVLKKQKVLGVDYIVHSCGCTMISPTIALTAAHCVEYADYVKVGKLYRKTVSNENIGLQVETFKVKKTRIHPAYDPVTYSNDVAILKFNNKSTKPIATLQLSKSPAKNINEDLAIVGWGFTSFGTQIPSGTLRHVHVRYMNTTTCEANYYKGLVDTSMFCAYAPGKDACQGDSGGPIFRKDTNGKLIQVGIISWGYKCGIFPGVYTNLSDDSIAKWIEKATCKGRGKDKTVCAKGKLKNSL